MHPAFLQTLSLAVMVGLLLFGASLFRTNLDVARALLSCLAATMASFLVSLLLMPVIATAAGSVFSPAVADIVTRLISMAVSLLVLGSCLVLVANVSVRTGWSLALLANGGATVAHGFFGLYVVGTGGAPGAAVPYAWGTIAYGAALALGGYLMGRNEMGSLPEPSQPRAAVEVGSVSGEPGGSGEEFRRTIAPVTFAAPASGSGRPTEGHNPTILHEERERPVATGWLVLSVGRDKGRKFDLRQGDNKIGRASDCEIRVTGDEEISRQHCVIRVAGPRHELHDLASINHTFLNSDMVRGSRVLRDGDEIRIGNSVLTFKQVG